MLKIAIIGAGSMVLSKPVIADILATPALRESEICLMNRTSVKLRRMEGFLKKAVKQHRLPTRITSTLNRREAIEGADYIILMIQAGGIEAFKLDYEIPLQFGVDQCAGDTINPGGVFRGLRTIPILHGILSDAQELAPDALILNYIKPMGICCQAIGALTQQPFLGLCHGVQSTLGLISGYLRVPKDRIDTLCAGINNMAWFLSLRDKRTGKDLYPRLRKICERPEYFINDKARIELMRHFGFFPTESTGRLSEYAPWFRSSRRALQEFCDEPAFGGASGAYYHYCRMLDDKYKDVDYLEAESFSPRHRSAEYCSYVLEAHRTGKVFALNASVINHNYITNLPQGCCVEVPVFVDRSGFHPSSVGELPSQCAALNQSSITVQNLAVEASLSGNPEGVMQALAMDPLTSSVCTLREIRELTDEMLRAQARWLPQFRGRKLLRRPQIRVTPSTRHASIPPDPSLAVANRICDLATRRTDQLKRRRR